MFETYNKYNISKTIKQNKSLLKINYSFINFVKKNKDFNEEEIIEDFVYMLEFVKKNMFVPGKIEKWIIFVDVKGLTLSFPLKVFFI